MAKPDHVLGDVGGGFHVLFRRTRRESESLALTASITSVVVVTGSPFMLTITSWSFNPELGGEKKG